MNKKYQVFKRLNGFTPSYENEFNDLDDARMYRNLCQKTENESKTSTYWTYYIVEVIE
jgi:hypothetical protein